LSERFKKDNPVWKKGVKEKLSKARKGMKLSKEWRDKISKANQKEKNSNWQGGKTKEFLKVRANLSQKLRVWRKAIYERDNYTCQRCGEKNLKKPKAHHIKSFKDYPKLRVDINNGICLCNKCHKEVHYGKK